LGELDYIAPFAYLKASGRGTYIHVGDKTNIQDNTFLDAGGGPIEIGDEVILAHGARILGKETVTRVGAGGACPDPDGPGPEAAPSSCPSFVGFNSEVDGAIVEKDAMVLSIARVAPGVRIPSGRKVLPGKEVASQDQVADKTVLMTAADRAFMAGVIEVNVNFAIGYTRLQAESPSNVMGINYDAGPTATDPVRDLPTFAGKARRDPNFAREFGGRARIVGDATFAQTKRQFSAVSGVKNALRADEGEDWSIGWITTMKDNVTWHALEDTRLELGNRGAYGVHSIVHGGPSSFGPFTHTTAAGTDAEIKDHAVLFNSVVGDDVTIGVKSLVQNSRLPSGTAVPDRVVILDDGPAYPVEW
jgi:carbonic anhydrase/acetyltransferase-like protein (isoleucine patch superfamily)